MQRQWGHAKVLAAVGVALGIITLAGAAQADEGMWTYDALPKAQIQQKYGFAVSDAWTAHLQHASVHLDGASGSFVSADGLVMTNHHVGLDTLQKLSSAAHDYVRDGFQARTQGEELKAPDVEMETLDSIVPVTAPVEAAVLPGMTAPQALRARRAAMARLEKDADAKTGLHCTVVTLFGGARYDLYRCKRYTDVRLVMAPEANTAFFGGDPDNFEFPRYDLDMCFFRAYENGVPAKTADYLAWNPAGPKVGDLIFVSGHPGRTSRLETVADLTFERDTALPMRLNQLRRREALWASWGSRLPENARVAHDRLFGVQNSRKDAGGELQALQDPALLAGKRASEQALRASVAADPKLQAEFGDAWRLDDQAGAASRAESAKEGLFTGRPVLDSELFALALTLVQKAEEDQKPNAQRLPDYQEGERAGLEQFLFSPAPISPEFERLNLADSLAYLAETRGLNDPLTTLALAGIAPPERAAALVNGTRLADVAERRRLSAGGLPAILASSDPMIRLARALDPLLRARERAHDAAVVSVRQKAYAKIARAQSAAAHGAPIYPDATGTLRLSYGVVAGYSEDGKQIPAFTTLGGLFPYAAARDNLPPYLPSPSWLSARPKIAPGTPFDFVCTADIIGGNSGSPVVDRAGRVVGLIFDGNIQSLGGSYAYEPAQNRAVAVDTAAILEALRHIYSDTALANELASGHRR